LFGLVCHGTLPFASYQPFGPHIIFLKLSFINLALTVTTRHPDPDQIQTLEINDPAKTVMTSPGV